MISSLTALFVTNYFVELQLYSSLQLDTCNHTSNFADHSYDYKPNWTPLSPITINNKYFQWVNTTLI